MTRVLVIDDHPIVLQGCRRMLQDAGINDVFEARDPETGYRLYCSHTPEVVVVDLGMQDKGLSGLELIRRIRGHDAHVRILVFSMHSDPVIVARALQAGATGYVVEGHISGEIYRGVPERADRNTLPGRSRRTCHAGCAGRYAGAAKSARRIDAARTAGPVALGRGQALRSHRRGLNVSYKTVVNLSAQLKQKLDARNLPELIRTAVQLVSAS